MRPCGMIGAVNRALARRLAYPLTVAALLGGCASTRSAVNAAAPPGRPIATPAVSGSATPTASGSATPAASAPGTSSPSAVACPPSGVRLDLGGIDAAMGLRALGLNLINCGRKPYRVNGYPAVHALDKERSTLDVRVLHGVTEISGSIPDWSGPPRPFVLEPGERATAVVVWRNTYDNISRPPVDAPYLEVAPAAGRRPAQVLAPQGGIDLGSTGRLGVSPWRPSPAPAP
jgi:hypothetical protein